MITVWGSKGNNTTYIDVLLNGYEGNLWLSAKEISKIVRAYVFADKEKLIEMQSPLRNAYAKIDNQDVV